MAEQYKNDELTEQELNTVSGGTGGGSQASQKASDQSGSAGSAQAGDPIANQQQMVQQQQQLLKDMMNMVQHVIDQSNIIRGRL